MPKKITAETDIRILKETGHHAEGIGTDSIHAYVEDAIQVLCRVLNLLI